jgi:hypothetical protein
LEEFPVELGGFAAFIEITMLRAQPAPRLGMAERLLALPVYFAKPSTDLHRDAMRIQLKSTWFQARLNGGM